MATRCLKISSNGNKILKYRQKALGKINLTDNSALKTYNFSFLFFYSFICVGTSHGWSHCPVSAMQSQSRQCSYSNSSFFGRFDYFINVGWYCKIPIYIHWKPKSVAKFNYNNILHPGHSYLYLFCQEKSGHPTSFIYGLDTSSCCHDH